MPLWKFAFGSSSSLAPRPRWFDRARRFLRASAWVAVAGFAFKTAPTGATETPPASGYFYDTFGVEVGLPHTNIAHVLQTRDGYLWVATPGGLGRFDGVRFVSFLTSNTPALVSSAIRCLYEDRDGWLWVGTDRGVVRERGGIFERIGLTDTTISAIVQDGAGRIWLGTSGRGLFVWQNGRIGRGSFQAEVPGEYIRFLFVDQRGRLWLGFRGHHSLGCYDGTEFQLFDAAGEINDDVQAMAEWPKDTLWFGTVHQGLFQLRNGRFARFSTEHGLANMQVTDLRPARDGGLWVVAQALQKITDPDRVACATVWSGPSETAAQIWEDREGSVWICEREDGLVRARRMPYRLIGVSDGLPGPIVKTVSQDTHGCIWTPVLNAGIARVSPEGTTRIYDERDGFPGHNPGVVYADKEGGIWAGFADLCWLRDGEVRSFPSVKEVRGIYQDSQSALWFGTNAAGLFRYRDGRFDRIDAEEGKPIVAPTSFCEDANGAFYVGCWSTGLVKFQHGKAIVLNHQQGLPSDEVRAVYADKEGRLWVGLRGRGLAVLAEGHWYNAEALCEAVAAHVSAIAEDDRGQLWLGTPQGVMWGSKEDLFTLARGLEPASPLHVAGVSNGFQITPAWSGGQPIVCKTSDHKLLFATRRGVIVIDPDNIPINRVPPPVHIEKVIVDQRELAPDGPIRLEAGTRVTTIEYTALSFLQPNRTTFKYRLVGYDRDWLDAGTRRVATYTNLPPRAYTFEVKAGNSDGVWNELGDRIRIVQRPYFYQTWWFYGLATLGLAASGLGFYRWRTAALRRENERLERGIAERTRELELANTAKSELLENISHELRNPLNGLTGLLELLKQENLGSRARDLTTSLQVCARGFTRVFAEVLDYSRLEYETPLRHEVVFSVRALLAEVAESFAWSVEQQGVRITIEEPPDFADGFSGDEGKIKTIVSNFISNAIKYAPRSPIELKVDAHDGEDDTVEVSIEVCDHGPGIPIEEQELVFKKFVRGSAAKRHQVAGTGLGLATCTTLARSLDGNVGVDSQPGQGAVFFLCVPLRRAALTAVEVESAAHAAGTALIVEDERYNQMVLKSVALELGYAVEVASNAEQAFARLEERSFDVVFLDWELPGTKGEEVARHVRARPDGNAPVILATTAHSGPEVRRRCEEAGMDEFLLKPYSAGQVRERIAAARTRRRRGEVSTPASAASEHRRAGALDLDALRRYARVTGAGEDDAARVFAEALNEELRALRDAQDAGELEQVAYYAHRLNALSALIGANEVCERTERIERLGRKTANDERRLLIESLGEEIARLQRQIASLTLAAAAGGSG